MKCFFCDQEGQDGSTFTNKRVCLNCVPYRLYGYPILNNTRTTIGVYNFEDVFVVNSEEYIPNTTDAAIIIVRGSVIKDIALHNSTLHFSEVTFKHCRFSRIRIIGLPTTVSKLNFVNCSGEVETSCCLTVTVKDCDMTIHDREESGMYEVENSVVTMRSKANYITAVNSSRLTVLDSQKVKVDDTCHLSFTSVPTCSICKNTLSRGRSISVNDKVIHYYCFSRKGSDEVNLFTVKEGKDKLPRFSIEHEMNGRDEEFDFLLLDLLEANCIRKEDGTVTDEILTPIFTGIEQFKEYESLFRRSIPYVNESARTHIHVSASNRLKNFLQKNYMMFDALSYWISRCDNIEDFFGCGRSSLCPLTVDPHDRFHYINIASHYTTIEYRLARFDSWRQYLRLVCFYREFTYWLRKKCLAFPEFKTGSHLSGRDIDTLSCEIKKYWQTAIEGEN